MTSSLQNRYLATNIQGDEPLSNHSQNPHIDTIIQNRFSRRTLLQGIMGATAVSFLGANLSACGGGSDSDDQAPVPTPSQPQALPKMGFKAISTSRADSITLPTGYQWAPLLPWGEPICGSYPDYREDASNTGKEALEQMGMNHDGMHFFPINGSSEHGLLVMNHEYTEPAVQHPNGRTLGSSDERLEAEEVLKEMAAHGVSVVEIKRSALGGSRWEIVRGQYNRRITALTEMEIRGPVRGHNKLKNKFSKDGTLTRGTLNNCSSGKTPWGTYMAAEENWAGYFYNDEATPPREHSRYGVGINDGYYGAWHSLVPPAGHVLAQKELSQRFYVAPTAASASEDYRNEANNFGWMVEIDPFDPYSTPKKRTSLGRFGHEGVIFAKPVVGQPIVCYSGDDARYEYIYKFVSKAAYQEGLKGDDLLEEGTLYVAKFNEDNSGEWLALDLNDVTFAAKVEAAKGTTVGKIAFDGFADQGDVLINTRLAADIAGATKMDRPEWGEVCPRTGLVYFTLTNNSKRKDSEINAANPRAKNNTGHIIRWEEKDGQKFSWDIFLLAGHTAGTLAGKMLPGSDKATDLTADNVLSCPDGLYFDTAGGMWIQTDMSESMQDGSSGAGDFGNNQMLLANPATGEMKRFLVGPTDCEVTGISMTPDRKTMFVNIQHPGDRSTPGNFTSHFPANNGISRPRSTTVVITRQDGGIIGD